MGAHRQLACEFTVTKDFDAAGRPVGQTDAAQCGFIDSRPIFELIENIEIHRDITCRVTRVIETALGNTANKGHLTTFKADSNRTTETDRLTFTAAPANLTITAGFT